MEFSRLQPLLSEESAVHHLLAYHTSFFSQTIENKEQEQKLFTELSSQIDFFHDDKNKSLLEQLVTQKIRLAIAKNYIKLLMFNKGKLFDTATKFVNILAQDANNKKKLATYSALKELSVVILTCLYENFGHEITSFIPLTLLTSLRILKRNPDDNSSYSINLSQLVIAICKNSGDYKLFIDDSLITRFNKLFKSQIESKNCSVILTANYWKVWQFFQIQTDSSQFQQHLSPIILNGLKSKEKLIRTSASTTLAELLILFNYDLKTIFSIFIEFYIEGDNFVEVSVIESIIQFISINFAKNYEFLNNKFLNILNYLLNFFSHERILQNNSNEISKILNHLDYICKKMLKFIGDSNQRLLFDKLFKNYLNFNDEKKLNHLKIKPVLNILDHLLDNLFNLSEMDLEIYQISLLKLSTCSNFQIRIQSIEILVKLSSNFPKLIPNLMENSFNELSNNFKQGQGKTLHFVKTHGLSLILSRLFSIAKKDYVSVNLINNILKLILPNLTSNSVSNYNDNTTYYKSLTSFVVLIGSFNYSDNSVINEYSLAINQIFEINNFKLITDSKSSVNDLQRLLDIDVHLLTSILNYLNNFDIDNELITKFSKLMDSKYEIIKYFKYSDNSSSKKHLKKDLEYLIDLLEKRILQIYIKLIPFIKEDFNSLIMIQVIKNFAKLLHFDSSTIKANENEFDIAENDTILFNGLTSKFNGFEIDELSIKFPSTLIKHSMIDEFDVPKNSIESKEFLKSPLQSSLWFDQLENLLICPMSTSLDEDYFCTLYQSNYSIKKRFPIITKLSKIDHSIEIFSLVFPYLTTKVQLSLIENLRTFILNNKNSKENYLKIILINSSIAIHGMLSNLNKKGLQLDHSIIIYLFETLQIIYNINPTKYLLNLNSDSIGVLISKLENNNLIEEQVQILIKKIMEVDDSNDRVFNLLILSKIHKFNSSKNFFKEIFEVLNELSFDSHPKIHSWSVIAIATMIDNHVAINKSIGLKILNNLSVFTISDKFGNFNKNFENSNINLSNIDSSFAISKILNSLISSLGPEIKELNEFDKQIIKNLVIGLIYFNNDYLSNSSIQIEILNLLQQLIIYDENIIDFKEVVSILEFNLRTNLIDSIGSNLTFNNHEEQTQIFPVTTSEAIIKASLELLYQLIKIRSDKSFLKEVESFIWIYLEIYPNSVTINKLINEWLNSTFDINWFEKLIKLFNSNKQQLYLVVFNNNEKVLNKYKNKKVEVNVTDEELQSITKKDEDEDIKNGETVNWRFKLNILKFLKNLLNQQDEKLRKELSAKVSELIKISFISSTSEILELRILGIELLNDIITIFSKFKDPLYPQMSILEQEQAQITSALVPAFQINSTPILASKALEVISKFIGFKIIKLNKLTRISKILVNSLKDLNNDRGEGEEEFKLNDVLISSEIGKKRVILSILNSWAQVKILNDSNKEVEDEELDQLVDEELEMLVPLWVSHLKEFAVVANTKNKENNYDELNELNKQCWINFVNVIGVLSEEKGHIFDELLGKDVVGFYLMIFIQNLRFLMIGSNNEIDKLSLISNFIKIVKVKELNEMIYKDDIFRECINIWERIVLTGENCEKKVTIKVISSLFNEAEEVDKLFELVGVMFQCLKCTLSGENEATGADFDAELILSTITLINGMICKFPELIKQDLYLNFIEFVLEVLRGFGSEDDLVTELIPLIGDILDNIGDIRVENYFFQEASLIKMSQLNRLLTYQLQFSHKIELKDYVKISEIIISGFFKPELIPISVKIVKLVIVNEKYSTFKVLLPILIKILLKKDDIVDQRIIIEILIVYVKQLKKEQQEDKLYAIINLLICLLIFKYGESKFQEFIQQKLLQLLQFHPSICKDIINSSLTAEQKSQLEQIVM